MSKVSFTGLHSGAPFVVGKRGAHRGGVGCLLAIPGKTGPSFMVTAGHLFRRIGQSLSAAPSGASRFLVGQVSINLLDAHHSPILDAALVELTPLGAELALSTRAPFRLTRIAYPESLFGVKVQAYLPTKRSMSRPMATLPKPQSIWLDAGARAGRPRVFGLIKTDRMTTSPGDSGTVLTLLARPQSAAAICVGRDAAGSYFAPLLPILNRLIRLSGTKLQLWSAR